jgi:hypothetical protein
MKGWRFLFLSDLTSAAELPPDMEGFKQQQYRWAKGGAQTCRKLLPTILRSNLPKRIKLEAFFHLSNCMVYLFVMVLTLLLYPMVYLKVHAFGPDQQFQRYAFDASILLLATFSGGTFYAASQRVLFRTWSDSLKYLPFLMSLGVGICLNNARAVLAGFFGRGGEFVRTPKFGVTAENGRWRRQAALARSSRAGLNWQPFAELAIGMYLLVCLVLCLTDHRVTIGVPFLALFATGYLYVPLLTLFGHRMGRAEGDLAEPAVEPVRPE